MNYDVRIVVSAAQRAELERIVVAHGVARGIVLRARIILMADMGAGARVISESLGVCQATVRRWRTRFQSQGVVALFGGDRLSLNALSLPLAPSEGPAPASRADAVKHSPEISFANSSINAAFVQRVQGISGLYMHFPLKALCLRVPNHGEQPPDERAAPPRHGAASSASLEFNAHLHQMADLKAALRRSKMAIGAGLPHQPRQQDLLDFLSHLDSRTSPQYDLHLIVNNYSAFKHMRVAAWLAHRPRFHLHLSSGYYAWLNQTERWIAVLSARLLRNAAEANAHALREDIDAFVKLQHFHAQPFRWAGCSDPILAKVERLTKFMETFANEEESYSGFMVNSPANL